MTADFRAMNIHVVPVGKTGAQVRSALTSRTGHHLDGRFDILALAGCGPSQVYGGGAHAEMLFIVGDARDPIDANTMLRTLRPLGHCEASLTFLVSPVIPEVVRRDLRGLDCCLLEVGDVGAAQMATQAILGPTHAMLVPGLVGISFEDIRRVFGGRCSGWSAHRSPPGGGEVVAQAVARETVVAIAKPDLHERPTKCLAVVYVGPGGTLHEVQAAAELVEAELHHESEVALAAMIDDELGDQIGTTLSVAAVFDPKSSVARS